MIKLCKDCKWSQEDKSSSWNLRCVNVEVNKKDAWALSSAGIFNGTNCHEERQGQWFSVCGMKGKKWEKKDE
jgi:hypothetical protein